MLCQLRDLAGWHCKCTQSDPRRHALHGDLASALLSSATFSLRGVAHKSQASTKDSVSYSKQPVHTTYTCNPIDLLIAISRKCISSVTSVATNNATTRQRYMLYLFIECYSNFFLHFLVSVSYFLFPRS